MITKQFDGTVKLTPKQKAAEILDDWMDRMDCGWADSLEGYTDKELEAVKIQLDRYINRVFRLTEKARK
jgi:hypothetical protein